MNGPLVVASAAEADFAEIAAVLGMTKQSTQERAFKEAWPYREVTGRGGKKRLFALPLCPPPYKTRS